MEHITRLLITATRAALVAVLVAGVGVVLAAEPASAHGLGGVEPTNYESRLRRVSPSIDGIDVEVVDLGTKLALTNRTARDVIVLGYDDEPYLRVGPRGVFENTRSPSTYINRSTAVTTDAPRTADSSAPPRWKPVSSGHTATWHDHRAHFMGEEDPPAVRRAPDHRLVFDRWTVTIRYGDRTITARGEIAWVPPPSPWSFVIAAIVLALAVFAASRTRWWTWVMAGSLVVIVVADALHIVGLWDASTASTGTKLAESAYSLGGLVLGFLALAWMARRGANAAVPLVLVATIVLVIAGGLADVTTLGHSQILTAFPETVARVLVTLTLGLGVGLAAAAGARLHSSAPMRPRPQTREREAATVTS